MAEQRLCRSSRLPASRLYPRRLRDRRPSRRRSSACRNTCPSRHRFQYRRLVRRRPRLHAFLALLRSVHPVRASDVIRSPHYPTVLRRRWPETHPHVLDCRMLRTVHGRCDCVHGKFKVNVCAGEGWSCRWRREEEIRDD